MHIDAHRPWAAPMEHPPGHPMRHLGRLAGLLAMLVLLASCSAVPLRPGQLHSPALRIIHAAFQRTVEAAHDDPDIEWHSGWLGNMWVNFWKGDNRGLCYQWQQLVYNGVAPAARRAGWDATGIVINGGTRHEHHAVLVFDPKEVRRDALLTPEGRTHVYVLDAWREGQADIYRLTDWLRLPFAVADTARLQTLQVQAPGS
jgi:hypothetical protein